ncbi:MAG: 2-hydroxyacid dehydrogenase family protein [Tannerella sp.]|jgi:lactate dehydrogenase-like 2-hydroxyacid dehydrogenase|nr:2-hydroxyacid dehydrogenase family protein [Tannerella sp.]
MKKILVTYNMFQEGFEELKQRYEVTFPSDENRDFSYEEILKLIPKYDALCSMFDFPINKKLIDQGLKLRLVANYAAGYDNIDVKYAEKKGITVTNTPDTVTEPTANLALCLLLDTARRVSECDRNLRRLGRDMNIGVLKNLGMPVSKKTLGIIGMGRIGKALCRRARACGMEVIYHNRHRLDASEETHYGAMYATFDELLAQADFVSVNAPHTPETHHIIDEHALRQMKSTAILINTARGPLVDEKALIKALQKNEIHGAGLDVFEFGDYPSDELLKMENVVLTPHIGTQTTYSRIEMARAVCNNVIGFFENDRPITRVLQS